MANEKTEDSVKKTEEKPEVVTATASPVNPVEKKSSNKGLIIVLVIVLILCCCATVAVVGFFFFNGIQSATNNVNSTDSSSVNTTTAVEPTETDVINTEKAPTLAAVKAKYLGATSYHFSGDASFADGSKIKFNGEFIAPNTDHYITTEDDGTVTEEISINGTYYIKEAGAAWKKTTENYNAGVQRKEMVYLFDNIDMSIVAVSADNNFWVYKYTDSANEETWEVYVSKTGGFPVRITIDYKDDNDEQVIENIILSDYNDSEIVIKAPL